MLQKSDREELERKLEQTTRLASLTSDQTTLQRLREFAAAADIQEASQA